MTVYCMTVYCDYSTIHGITADCLLVVDSLRERLEGVGLYFNLGKSSLLVFQD